MAVLSADENMASSHTLVFDQVEINLGGAYNSSNGRFTSPLTGIYQFTFYARRTSDAWSAYWLQLNGVTVAHIFQSYYSDRRSSHSLSQLLCVKAGQYVELRAESDCCVEGEPTNSPTWFYGYLVHAGC